MARIARTRWLVAFVALVAAIVLRDVMVYASADATAKGGSARKTKEARSAKATSVKVAKDKVTKDKAASGKAAKDPVRAEEAMLVQVLLDRAGFSVGEIDAAAGAKTAKALTAFQTAKGLAVSGMPDAATIEALGGQRSPTVTYTIAAADVAGPFVQSIPRDLGDQGELEALSYTSPLEQLAERFHVNPTLLRKLNPNAKFVEGEEVLVPDVEPAVYPTVSERRNAKTVDTAAQTDAVLVSRGNNDVVVQDASGQVLFYAPVSSGSEHDPLPIGEWKVLDVFLLPQFNYNPDLFWDADPKHAKTKIKPGPNNPVGVVWIDIDREHYGLHGTPEPSKIGVTQSHGCVRLTNWDAIRLASLVQPGTRVVFRP